MDKEILLQEKHDTLWEKYIEEHNLLYNYLHYTDIYMYQRKDMFRNNTDTASLGMFMDVKQKDRVLDIGTNNGALLLYASRMHPASLTGIDILEEACTLANINMEYNQIEANIVCSDFRDFEGTYDVIVCNPPYFDYNDPRVQKDNFRDIARHSLSFTLDELASHVSRLLSENGRIYLVHRSDYTFAISSAFSKVHMEVKRIQYIHHTENKKAHGVLLEIKKHAKTGCLVEKPLILNK